MAKAPSSYLTTLGVWTSRPGAFLIFAIFAVLWPFMQPDTFDWHAVATLATWFMTLLIQRAEHRDTQGIHAKLDEILRTQSGASNELAEIDEEEPEAIEKKRATAQERSRARR